MPHGFLNYNSPMMGMKDECNEAINQGTKWLKDLAFSESVDF